MRRQVADNRRKRGLAAKAEGALLEQPEPALDEGGQSLDGSLPDASTVMLAEMPFAEVEELRTVVTEARERGYVTPEEIAATLEEADPTREQVSELHQY